MKGFAMANKNLPVYKSDSLEYRSIQSTLFIQIVLSEQRLHKRHVICDFLLNERLFNEFLKTRSHMFFVFHHKISSLSFAK